MDRGFHFGAGPAMLPLPLLLEVQSEMLNWQGMGMSILEVGHRTPEYLHLMEEAERLLRALLSVPDNYHVLLLGGSARLQFGMIPLNLLKKDQQAGYLITGLWSQKAYDEAARIKRAYCIASSSDKQFLSVPSASDWAFQENTQYLYFTPNETINGVRCPELLQHNTIPVVADMTSCLLSEVINVNDYGLIFAGAQKNIANAGMTLVIIRDDLLNSISDKTLPDMLDYRNHALHKSVYSTPPTFNCYLALKMFQWIEKQGGVAALAKINAEKASKLYTYIDNSPCYECRVSVENRSLMNVCFTLVDSSLEDLFIDKATERKLYALKGHKTAGGIRASLYNAMPMEGVIALITFMDEFAQEFRV